MTILHQNTTSVLDELSDEELTVRIALLDRVSQAAQAEINMLGMYKLERARARMTAWEARQR